MLPKPVKRSLGFLLASIALWYIGYNGVTTWWSTYVGAVMGQGLGGASTCLLIATAGAVVSYIPIGQLASRIGRKKTILFGCALLAAMLPDLSTSSPRSTRPFIPSCSSALPSWALPGRPSTSTRSRWCVEMCRGSDIGKFTGYYYTFSMAAQVVTPVLAGTLMRHISYRVLFPYAALFVGASFVTMCFVRHGDSRAEAKSGLAAFEDMDD